MVKPLSQERGSIGSQEFWSLPDSWVFRRMTAQPPEVQYTEVVPVTPESIGVTTTNIVLPAPWRFAASPDPTRDPRHPAFVRFNRDSVVLSSEDEVDAALNAVAVATAKVPAAVRDEVTLNSELPSWTKFTIQKGTVGSFYVQRQGGGHLQTTLPPSVARIANHIAAIYSLMGPITSAPKADPANTNSGWPAFNATPLASLAGHILFEQDWDRMMDNGLGVASALGLDQRSAFAAGLGARSGPSYKFLPLLRFTGSGWEQIGEWKGHAQRNRVVQMAQRAINRTIRPAFHQLHERRKRIPGLWHAGDVDRYLVSGRRYWYESDISGFDVRVTPELQQLMAWALSRHIPELAHAISLGLRAEQLPLITPSWGLTMGLGNLSYFVGGTRSGMKWTAEVGTFYALTAALFALSKQGVNVFEWPVIPGITILVSGDDVLIASDEPLSTKGWAEAHEELGLSATLIEGDLFLAKHRKHGTPYPSAGRIVQQTLSNEHEPHFQGDERLSSGLSALGFIARTEGAHAIERGLSQLAARCCWHARWLRQYIGPVADADLETLRNRLIADPVVTEDIMHALRKRAGMSWAASIARDAEHSPAAAAMVEVLRTRFGFDVTAQPALDVLVERLASTMLRRCTSIERQHISAQAVAASWAGEEAATAFFSELTNKYAT